MLLIIRLGVCCLVISLAYANKPQLHPNLQVQPHGQMMDPFPNAYSDEFSAGKAWLPTSPTIFYQTRRNNALRLAVIIENVFSDQVKLRLGYRCSKSDAYTVVPLVITETICTNLPISVSILNVTMISVRVARIVILVSPTLIEGTSGDMSEFQFLKLTFDGGDWSLDTNGIYIKKWNWLGSVYSKGLLTGSATSLIMEMNLTSLHGFDSEPFLRKEVSDLIVTSPEFLKSSLSIGVLLQFNTGAFDYSRVYLRLMTDSYPWNIKSSDFKTFRIDWETGLMHYSRFGLKDVVARMLKASPKRNLCRKLDDCVVVTGCNFLSNPSVAEDVVYTLENKAFYNEVNKDNYLVGLPATVDSKYDECKVLNYPKKIIIFAGIERLIICPIICSMVNKIYGFYRGSEPLLVQQFVSEGFTKYGALTVHSSGAALLFQKYVTHADSGEYSCVANGLRATFHVEIVALPMFNVPDSELINGNLPPKIYIHEGDSYSLNCTVFYSSMTSVTVTPAFHVVTDRRTKAWSTLSGQAFKQHLDNLGSSVKLDVDTNSFSTTVTLTVNKVPDLTDSYDFSHRFVCLAATSTADALRFGLLDYNIQSVSDVLLFQRPTLSDFQEEISSCCNDTCTEGEECSVQVSLRQSVTSYLRLAGIEVRAEFVAPATSWHEGLRKWILDSTTFDADEAKLRWLMYTGLNQLSSDKRTFFGSMAPVFTFVNPLANRSGLASKILIVRQAQASQSVCGGLSSSCISDPSCIYSTAMDKTLTKALSVPTKLGVTQNYLNYMKKLPEEFPAQSRRHITLKQMQNLINTLKMRNRASVIWTDTSAIIVGSIALLACLWLHFP